MFLDEVSLKWVEIIMAVFGWMFVCIAAVGNIQPDLGFTTKEIERTIHVGTPAFLAPEILLKLVKSKGVNLRKKRKKR